MKAHQTIKTPEKATPGNTGQIAAEAWNEIKEYYDIKESGNFACSRIKSAIEQGYYIGLEKGRERATTVEAAEFPGLAYVGEEAKEIIRKRRAATVQEWTPERIQKIARNNPMLWPEVMARELNQLNAALRARIKTTEYAQGWDDHVAACREQQQDTERLIKEAYFNGYNAHLAEKELKAQQDTERMDKALQVWLNLLVTNGQAGQYTRTQLIGICKAAMSREGK